MPSSSAPGGLVFAHKCSLRGEPAWKFSFIRDFLCKGFPFTRDFPLRRVARRVTFTEAEKGDWPYARFTEEAGNFVGSTRPEADFEGVHIPPRTRTTKEDPRLLEPGMLTARSRTTYVSRAYFAMRRWNESL